MRKYFLILVSVFFASALFAQDEIIIEGTISEGVVRPVSLAIPSFTDETGNMGDIASGMADVVVGDLRSTGLFRGLPADTYLVSNVPFDAPVDFANWSGIGADIYLKAAVANAGDGKMSVKFRVYDVITQSELGEGVQYTANTDEWRRMAHKISDAIYERYTGEGGYFDSRIVFVDESGPQEARIKRLAVMDSDGANLEYLTSGEYIVLAPRWAGNTRDVIYTSYESGTPQIMLMNTETGETQVVSEKGFQAFSPRFSPNGDQLVMSLSDSSGNTDIYVVETATRERFRLTKSTAIDTAPSYSPDGEQIVFESNRSGSPQLYVMSVNGGDERQISNGAGRYSNPVWSHDGELIAFTKMADDGRFHIGIMNVDGSDERLISSAYLDAGPTWAPNGRVLMFYRETSGQGGSAKLQSVSLTGRNLVEIETPEFASDPDWSALLD